MKVLVAGGAGYIGGVTVTLLLERGHSVDVLDDFSSTTSREVKHPGVKIIRADVMHRAAVERAIADGKYDVVMNFAAKIRVDESMQEPQKYFRNNAFGTLNLAGAVSKSSSPRLILSSTAAVYGEPENTPTQESDRQSPINPYGTSKLIAEQILRSYELTHGLQWVAFRYFNAAGAYGESADFPCDSHLLPLAIEALLAGKKFMVNGNDYDTADGTCVRDYVHVYDIARAHIGAAERMVAGAELNQAINLGSGRGYSVLEVLKALERAGGKPVNKQFRARRAGDPAELVASNERAKQLLDWEPERDLDKIVGDAYAWRSTHPSA